MIGQLLAVPLVWRVGILLSLLAATIVAENLHSFQAEDAEEAALMLRDGRQAAAKPLHASDTITVAVSFGFTRIYRVHYTFADDQGRQWTGGGPDHGSRIREPNRPVATRTHASRCTTRRSLRSRRSDAQRRSFHLRDRAGAAHVDGHRRLHRSPDNRDRADMARARGPITATGNQGSCPAAVELAHAVPDARSSIRGEAR